MEKIIKKIGGSHVLILDREDRQIHGIKEGDFVQIELSKIPEVLQND